MQKQNKPREIAKHLVFSCLFWICWAWLVKTGRLILNSKHMSQQEIDVMCSAAAQTGFHSMTMDFLQGLPHVAMLNCNRSGLAKAGKASMEADLLGSGMFWPMRPGWTALRSASQTSGGWHLSHTLAWAHLKLWSHDLFHCRSIDFSCQSFKDIWNLPS